MLLGTEPTGCRETRLVQFCVWAVTLVKIGEKDLQDQRVDYAPTGKGGERTSSKTL